MQAAEWLETSILDLEVLIVDCQTTGATPEQGCVLELGWCLARAREVDPAPSAHAHWIALPEGRRVSSAVRQLTGFHEGLLVNALPPEEAWQRLRASLSSPATAPVPAAIHFARFELAFLRDWSRRFDPEGAFPIDAVCVHAIACRLFPDLPRRNLRALAGFLGHGVDLERRALGHVVATAFIWRKLAALLAERCIRSWAELTSWLAAPSGPRAPRRRTYPMPSIRYRELPDGPGVYRLLRSNGDVLYVGKAKSLRKRVASHFGKQRGATERALEMLTQVSDVGYEATATALEAALLETELIKALAPPYNVQLVRGDRGAWFASSDLASTASTPDERHRLGPLPSRFSVRSLRAVVELATGEAPSLGRRAAATGAPRSFAPDDQSFAAGWSRFAERRLGGLPCPPDDARGWIMVVARELLLLAGETAEMDEHVDLVGHPDARTGAEAPSMASAAPIWDAARVCRHLERSLAGSYQVLRRSSWLCMLASSCVSYREPRDRAGRLLRLEDAELVEAAEMADGPLPTPVPGQARSSLQLAFDAARYDRLRILTSELKRIARDGGEIAVRLSRSHLLTGARLRNVLRLV
jgi:DNA polymerase-3 subunit epsilon